ncbi:hypothetical protein [Brucella pseudogrignonensis]|uniref:hypothetical protein n=1 Tax=Brucella pseudogrignonensis TaxID=419475 RepID=UPI00178C6E2E|nr:hypothetical protein [Brucella pseudogrignonensis]
MRHFSEAPCFKTVATYPTTHAENCFHLWLQAGNAATRLLNEKTVWLVITIGNFALIGRLGAQKRSREISDASQKKAASNRQNS